MNNLSTVNAMKAKSARLAFRIERSVNEDWLYALVFERCIESRRLITLNETEPAPASKWLLALAVLSVIDWELARQLWVVFFYCVRLGMFPTLVNSTMFILGGVMSFALARGSL